MTDPATLEDIRLERELDDFYQAHRHEWEFGVGDLVVIVSQGTGRYRDHCIYLGQRPDPPCVHFFWDLGRQCIIDRPWKQADVISRADWQSNVPEKSFEG